VTCAGHASISTGATPSIHGMVQNQWWINDATKMLPCTEDDSEKLVTYGQPVDRPGQTASRLLTTTLSDELRLQLPVAPRVVGISLKARSAIMLAGRHPDAVIWEDEVTGVWTTSTAFATTTAPFFAEYIKAHDVKSEVGRVWDRALPKDKYDYPVSTVGQQSLSVENTEFPHKIKGSAAAIDRVFTDSWESSPFSDAYLAGLAAAAIDGLKLGRNGTTDYLGISFSALDKVGHDFGPDSHEIQDVLIRLDRDLAQLIDKLDRDVGRANYVLALSADHGVSPVPERVKAQGYDAGRIGTAAMGRAIDQALAEALGPGKYQTRVSSGNIYFSAGVFEQLRNKPLAMEHVKDTVRNTPGVWKVFSSNEVAALADSGDAMLRKVALSYYPKRTGDLVMLQKPYWIPSSDTTSHGSGYAFDTHVPVILFGNRIKKGEYLQAVTPLDIAPTLAFLSGVTLPNASGRLLAEALISQ
jgi:predicted AlkP superfamily pyrophosphatase or phosphodiesterase